jgi:Uma2 family endonuclease
MAKGAEVIFEDRVRVPLEARSLEAFRRWALSPDFPERGRIDYLAGDIEVDMSPEDLYTHGVVKSAIAAKLHDLVVERDRGYVFIDCTRVSSPAADLSVEPDVVVLLWDSLESGRVREVPAASGKPNRFVELEGAPDLVVEVLSDSSERKDRRRLPGLYEKAGVPELWTVDARGEQAMLRVEKLEGDRYRLCEPRDDGFVLSPVLGAHVRLTRREARGGRWSYELEVAAEPRA